MVSLFLIHFFIKKLSTSGTRAFIWQSEGQGFSPQLPVWHVLGQIPKLHSTSGAKVQSMIKNVQHKINKGLIFFVCVRWVLSYKRFKIKKRQEHLFSNVVGIKYRLISNFTNIQKCYGSKATWICMQRQSCNSINTISKYICYLNVYG